MQDSIASDCIILHPGGYVFLIVAKFSRSYFVPDPLQIMQLPDTDTK